MQWIIFIYVYDPNLIPPLCVTGRGLPVLNEEGLPASSDADKGNWLSEATTSEVQISHESIVFYSLK